MDGPAQRAALAELTAASGESLAALSRLIGRNAAYLQQFVTRGSPRQLSERDRGMLARYFGVAEARLGGAESGNALTSVPRLDVGASAGPGGVVDGEARRRPGIVDPALLRQLGVRPDAASMIRVEGDSMEPTLAHGDEILIDRDRRSPVRGGLFVLRLEDVLVVKRLRAIGGDLDVLSDNRGYPARRCSVGEVEVIGRVVWLSRALV